MDFGGKLCAFYLSLLPMLSAWVSIQMLALKEGVCSEEEGTVEEQRWETPGLWWKIKVRTTQGQEEATVKKKQTRKKSRDLRPSLLETAENRVAGNRSSTLPRARL